MAAALLADTQVGVNAIVVGADRVAANGDTANKIGTYALAVLARYHGVKFLVATHNNRYGHKIRKGYCH